MLFPKHDLEDLVKLYRSLEWLYKYSSFKSTYLVVYMDAIVITENEKEGIKGINQHLIQHFQTKDLDRLR